MTNNQTTTAIGPISTVATAWTAQVAATASNVEAVHLAAAFDGWLASEDVVEDEADTDAHSTVLASVLRKYALADATQPELDRVDAEQASSTHEWPTEQPAERRRPRSGRLSKTQLVWEAFNLIQDVLNGKASVESLDGLELIASQPQGGEALADALEAIVSKAGGAERLVKLFGLSARSAVAARGLAAVAAETTLATPERAVGLFLLTTDAEGGVKAVGSLFAAAATEKASALHMSSFLAQATTKEAALRGTVELLDTLVSPQLDGDRDACEGVLACLAAGAHWVSGATLLGETFLRVMDAEGGPRCFARILRYAGNSRNGRDAAARLLNGLVVTDADNVVRLLARSCSSRNGARQITETLHRLTESERGERCVNRLMQRVRGSRLGFRFWEAVQMNDADGIGSLLVRLEGPAETAEPIEEAVPMQWIA